MNEREILTIIFWSAMGFLVFLGLLQSITCFVASCRHPNQTRQEKREKECGEGWEWVTVPYADYREGKDYVLVLKAFAVFGAVIAVVTGLLYMGAVNYG